MNTLLILVIVAVVLGGIALLLLKRLGSLQGDKGAWPYYVRKPMSQPEQVLYHRLTRALPEHIILSQVQVSRVLGVRKGENFREWNNRINRLSYDFVVCGKDSTVVAAIELDDGSHEHSSRVRTDEKKNRASADAGLRLVRWHVRTLPSEETIRAELLPSVRPDPTAGQHDLSAISASLKR